MRSLVTYKPNRSLRLFDDFDRVLDSFFDDVPRRHLSTPRVDIREEENAYVLEAELPGLSEKDVDVKVENELLTIASKTEEKKEEKKVAKKDGYLLKERRTSTFSRCFALPKDADREKIDAHFKNGVLTLNVPKSEESKPRTIDVKVN